MQTDLTGLSVSYPFIPFQGTDTQQQIARAIKDASIQICLPYNPALHQGDGNWIHTRLTTLRKQNSILFLDFQFSDTINNHTYTLVWSQVTGRVTTQAADVVVSTSSVITLDVQALLTILGQNQSITITAQMELNPSCILLFNKGPRLSLYSMPVQTTQAVRGLASDATAAAGKVQVAQLVFAAQGYNTTISQVSTGVTIYCAPGAGLGRTTDYTCWMDLSGSYTAPAGLLSINGLNGAVSIQGYGSVSVDTNSSGSAISLTLSVNA